MRAGLRCLLLLLLPACTDQLNYEYELRWVCLSPEGCERTEELMLFDRLNVHDPYFYFFTTRDQKYLLEDAQRLDSTSLPDGCWWLYAFSIFGHELEPSKVCSTSGGYDFEFSIPNRNLVTHSEWLVEAREFGIL
jgi:hypothetical protein